MAGDEYYLYLNDSNKNIISSIRIGQFRYWNSKFSLYNFVYRGDSSLYELDNRLSDGRTSYFVWDKKIINDIKKETKSDIAPITKEEIMAKDDTRRVLEWIKDKRSEHP